VALDAVDEIRATYRNFELLVIGPGTPIPHEGVRYLGSLGADQRDGILSIADMLIAPNTGQESFGLVLVEALAQGLRVVASDLPAFREVLSPDSDLGALPAGCALFPPGDSSALAQAVLRVLTVSASASAAAGWEHVQRYGWDTVGPQVLNAYQEACTQDSDLAAVEPDPISISTARQGLRHRWSRLRGIANRVVRSKFRAPSSAEHAVD
jgi:phosphatidylinositol alpha-mannosyltransferase